MRWPGIFGLTDIVLGKFSDGDDVNGNPKKSWGATVLFLTSIPFVYLVGMYGIAMYNVSSQKSPAASPEILKIYKTCISSAKTPIAKRSCKLPTVAKTNASIPDAKWPWIGTIAFFCVGVVFSLLRNASDFQRFKSIGSIALTIMKDGNPLPKIVENAFTASANKVLGSEITKKPPEDPGDVAG